MSFGGSDSQAVSQTVAAAHPSRRRRLSALVSILPWIGPAAAVIIFVFGYALFRLLTDAFEYKGSWVGLDNFSIVIGDPLFRIALTHNGLLLLIVPPLTAAAFVLAVLLFETRRGHALYRAAVFLPYILPIPVIAVVFGQLLQLNGAINVLLRSVGLSGLALDWLGDSHIALWTMAGIILWKEVGFGVILFLARMLSLSEDVYDAARIDGAGTWQMHFLVSMPQMRGVIGFYLVNEAITMVSWVFNYVYVLSHGTGGPGDSTFVSELYIYRMAFTGQAPELAAAAAVLLLGVTLVLIIALFRMQRESLRAIA
jgi:ABC-type sugar transport system permease subunit